MSTAVATEKDRFLEQLEHAPASPRFHKLHQAARERFRALPFPGPRSEDWRFTNLAPLLRTSFELPCAPPASRISLPSLPTPDTLRLVFVNGIFQRPLAQLDTVPAGVFVGSLADAPAERV